MQTTTKFEVNKAYNSTITPHSARTMSTYNSLTVIRSTVDKNT